MTTTTFDTAHGHKRLWGAIAAIASVTALLATATAWMPPVAQAACSSCAPWWDVSSESVPANLPPGGEGAVTMSAEDVGDSGPTAALTLTDKLPAGLTAQSVKLGRSGHINLSPYLGSLYCTVLPREVTCAVPMSAAEELLTPTARPYYTIEAEVAVKVAQTARSGEANDVSISGGGAPAVSIARPLAVSSAPSRFGVEQYELKAENADGSPDTQAGSHPFQLTSVLTLDQGTILAKPPAAVKDLHFNLPPGLIGNPTPVPQCSLPTFLNLEEGYGCPAGSVVGVAVITGALELSGRSDRGTFYAPLINLTPAVGEPARFGFVIAEVPVYLDTSIRSGGDYGVTVSVDNISEVLGFISSRVTFWGVPGDPRHDSARGICLAPAGGECSSGEKTPPPLLTLPTACTGPVHTTVEADSWEQEGLFTQPFEYTFKDTLGDAVGMDGCNRLPFTPSIKVTPDGQAASTPTGLTVDEHVPQESDLNPTGLSESAVKGLSVTLPEGVALNPAGADGLQACSQMQIALQNPEASACPEAAKVATVKIKTPVLPNPLEGAAYLAAQDQNPFGSLVALYIYAEDPVSGVRAKAAGEVAENPVTGQLTAHFEGDPLFQGDPRFVGEPEAQFLPEVPFEDIELHFFGGDRAPLNTPAKCGSYTTNGSFTPWSGNSNVESASQFQIVSGPNGSPCQSPLPFAPSLTAGTSSIQAGGFSPFELTMSREDGQQGLQGIELKMPPGMSGTLSTVKLCGEAQADAGACGPESQIGETVVSVGLGGDPYTVAGGKVYITGPYRGAPFGLSIVNPAKAGPFDLGQVVVRAKIEVDPLTAALTITTDDEGPYKIPTIIDGIPLQIRHVNVDINRPGFTFNATNCSPLAITGTLTSSEGSSAARLVPYQVTNCAVLAFKPKLSASTSARASRADGASLTVKLGYPAGPYDANISRVKVELPKALPSRLVTLQKACTAQVFEANPASCPAASVIGHATATTPVLPVPLTGPAYFVSHGGEAFPSLIIVLQGYGVTVHLVGSTFISKQGITSSTFKTVPDVPVGSFELSLPQGPYSALTANTSLCKAKLAMPTEFVGQSGALIKTTTKIAVAGCPKAKQASHKKKTAHKQAKHGRKPARTARGRRSR
jgi:hypothetical protein